MFFSNKKYCATKYAVAIAGLCLISLTGCSGDDRKKSSGSSSSLSSSSSSPLTNSPEVGHWYAPVYGYVLSVSAEGEVFTVKKYNVTEDYCVLLNVDASLPLDDLRQKYMYSTSLPDTLLEDKGVYLPAVKYGKLDQSPVICGENLQALKTDSGYTFDAKKDFEIFWQTFDELYINFELRGVNWSEVYEEAVSTVDDIKDEEQLFEFLSTLIAPLGDAHAVLVRHRCS